MLEHVLSEELEELIAAKLGHPTHDPHGDPIPGADDGSRVSDLIGQVLPGEARPSTPRRRRWTALGPA